MSDRATLVQIYIAFYNRAPDPEGLGFWQGACDDGLSLPEIAELFVPQDESIATYPFLGNPTEEGIRSFLQSVYENLFNREIDAAGETFWTNQILKSLSGEPGGLSIGEVLLSIITGAQGDDITTLDNKTTIALDFHDQAAALDGYMQNPAATTASRLALSVVDETDFSVVQGKVLNENYFEEFDGAGNPLLDPFMPGVFDPIVGPGQTALDEAPVNGILPGNQLSSDVAVLADGKVVTAYTITADGPNYVAFNIRNADGSLSLPDQQLLTPDERADGDIVNGSVILALPEGGFIISVRAFLSGQEASIVAYRYNATGEQIGDPMEIVPPDTLESIDSFDVTYLPTGKLLYTVAGDPVLDNDFGGPHDTFQMLVGLDGAPVTDLEIVNDNDGGPSNEDEPRSAGLPDGTTLVVFQTNDESIDGDDDAVVGQLYNAQGDAIGGPIVINENTTSIQRGPAVAALGEDRFIVVFETFSNVIDTQSVGISGVILNSDGSVDVDEFGINQRILGQQSSPDVAELGNGNFVVVWRDNENAGDIRARIFEDDGTIVTDDIAVSDLTPGSQSRPSVAATADGFVVTWDTNQPNVNDPFGTFSVRMAAFDEDGVRLPLPDQINPSLPMLQSGDFQVNDQIDDEQSQGTVVGLNDGRSVFSYFDEESLQTFFEVRGPDGSVLLPETMALQDPVLMPPPGFIFSVSNVQMAATADGGFVMVGSAFVPGFPDADFALQIFDADLTPSALIPVNASSGTNDFEPLVAIADNGEIIVTWTSQVGSDRYEAKIRKFAADGDPITDTLSVPENLPIGFLSIGQLPTSVAVSSSGQIAIVGLSTDAESNTSGQDVYLSLLNSDLERTFGGALASDQEGSQRQAKVIALEDGNFLVVFKDNNNGAPTASGDDISGVIIDGNGDAVGDTFLINTTTNSTQEMPDVITLDDGRILVAWTDFDTAVGTNRDVNARLLTADGTPIGNEFILNPNQDLSEEGVALTAVGDGFAATWQAGNGAPDDNTVRGAIFDEDLEPVETPLVLSNSEFGFLTFDQILDLQDIPLPGNPNDFFLIDSFGATALGGQLSFFAGGVRYNPFTLAPEINNLAEGDQLTEIFEYTVENATGDQVTLIGSFQIQGFEDVM